MSGHASDEEAVPNVDPNDTAAVLEERLRAWKHACGYLENYITATERMHKAHAKEYEKVLKTISDPLREGHHFDQRLEGIAGFFENLRSNTQAISNSHLETSKCLSGQVLPVLSRLHHEIKNKNKELTKSAAKTAKSVSAARNETQKYIELLGQHTAAFQSAGGKTEAQYDPYVLYRGTQHRLHKQVLEENNNRNDLLVVQESFASFEAHIVQTFQQAMSTFLQLIASQADRQKAMYADVVGTCQRIPLDFEWMNFLHRNGSSLIDPLKPQRTVSNISFPNQDHRSTKPLIAGKLERKSRALGGIGGFKTGYYAVTPAGFLHQFDDDDNFRNDPTPDLSLYLPDCTIGAVSGDKFNVKGKDVSKGKVGSAFQMTHEISFKAQTAADAQKWWQIISERAGSAAVTGAPPSPAASTTSSSITSKPPEYTEKPTSLPETKDLPVGKGPPSATADSGAGHEQIPRSAAAK